jgi:hypothetical protein
MLAALGVDDQEPELRGARVPGVPEPGGEIPGPQPQRRLPTGRYLTRRPANLLTHTIAAEIS